MTEVAMTRPGLPDRDHRRVVAAAALLTSDRDGEVVAAARALVCLLNKGNLDPAGVVSAGLSAVATPHIPAPIRYPSGYPRPLNERAWMARYSPHINDWERGFINDMIDRRGLSQRQESLLKSILRKSEGGPR